MSKRYIKVIIIAAVLAGCQISENAVGSGHEAAIPSSPSSAVETSSEPFLQPEDLEHLSLPSDYDDTMLFSPAYVDDPQSKLIRLTYVNETNTKMCLGAESWPSRGGYVNSNGRKYYLIIDNEKYYLQRQQDYCPRGCYDEVAPGGRLEATIPYSLFDMPSELFNRPKKLVFPSVATQCSE